VFRLLAVPGQGAVSEGGTLRIDSFSFGGGGFTQMCPSISTRIFVVYVLASVLSMASGCRQSTTKAELSDVDLLTSKSWLNWTVIHSRKLSFKKDGSYSFKDGADFSASGTWVVENGTLTVTGHKVLDDSQTKLIDAVASYKIEWLHGRKQLKIQLATVTVDGKETTKSTLSFTLDGTYD
jgi:hypothetical protein